MVVLAVLTLTSSGAISDQPLRLPPFFAFVSG
uniref:Uncharacterized protein n=1 Tax=Arundo donax TaxID=35708 RepID=A0A0A9HRS5_ARUDO